jgi:branched-chain amino acid transport system ATP-binding protein
VISVSHLSVSFGAVHALTDVSFDAANGKITAILGANGAGKTTLLRTITGLEEASAGDITLDGSSLLSKRTEDIARAGVGHVPEGRGVIAEFTVLENLRLGSLAAKVNFQEGLAEQFELFPVLSERRHQHAATLSGGERQMLAMARALIAKPSVLLLDEPSLGLAPLVTAEMMATISELCAKQNLTVLLVEQNAKSALKVAHQAVVLHLGKVVASASAQEVANDERLRQYYLGLVDQ